MKNNMQEASPPTLEEAEALIKHWQPLLGLTEWKIKIELIPGKKLDNSKHTAECWMNFDHKYATIKLANDIEIEEYARPDLLDWEQTIVHELVHCLIDPVLQYADNGNPIHTMIYEQLINSLSWSFINLERKNGPANITG